MFGVNNIPSNIFQELEGDINTINEMVKELQCLLVNKIYVRDPDIDEKEVFHDLVDKKLEAFIESHVQRCIRLVSSISILLEKNEEVSAMIIARSLLENIAFFWDFKSKLYQFRKRQLKNISQNQEQALTDFIADWSYSTRQKDLLKAKGAPEKKALSIFGQIRDLGKKKGDNSLKIYEFLSEIAHPNNYGCADRFSAFDEKERVFKFGKNVSENEGLPQILSVLLKLKYLLEIQKELQEEISWIKALIKPIWIASLVKSNE